MMAIGSQDVRVWSCAAAAEAGAVTEFVAIICSLFLLLGKQLLDTSGSARRLQAARTPSTE
jgi:hypothetical protein